MVNFASSSNRPWNDNRSNIQTVIIENGVKNIGNLSFFDCRALASITIPNSVTSIGNQSFAYCSSLTSINLNSVTSIDYFAFNECKGLTSVTIPKSMLSIGESIFLNCTSLKSINVDSESTKFSSIDGILFDKLQETLICCPTGKTEGILIPNSVKSIGFAAFQNCVNLTSINIPNSVTQIGNEAFRDCSKLTTIDFGDLDANNYLSSIGENAFYGCNALKKVYVEMETPVNIKDKPIFGSLNLSQMTLYVMYGTLSAYETAPIWQDFGTKKEFLYGGDGAVRWRFEDGNLTVSGTGTISNYYEIGDSGTKTNAPWDAVKSLINNIIVKDGITQIRYNNFYSCINVTKVEIGKDVTSIGNYAFAKCTSLDSVIIKGDVLIDVLSNSFKEVNTSQVVLKVPSANGYQR